MSLETPPIDPSSDSDLPPEFRAALNAPALEPRGWQRLFAPTFIGLFLWIAFYDQIPQETLALGGVGWPVLGAALGGVLCYALLYQTPAIWGLTTRRPLAVVSTSTFGVNGATWVPGLLVVGVQIVWLAVSTSYGTALSLRGLRLLQFLEPKDLQPRGIGGTGGPSLLFVITSLLWCYAAALVGRYLVRVIAALMNVYPILPAFMLGVTAVLAFKGLGGLQANEAAAVGASHTLPAGMHALLITIQMVFGFFATPGLLSADLGAAAKNKEDVRMGGLVGVLMASWVVTTLAILAVAGAPVRDLLKGQAGSGVVASLRFSNAVETLIGGRLAGAMLMGFGLAALAPACYASYLFSTRLNEAFPSVKRTRWTILGAGLAWLLVVSGRVERMYEVFSVVGGLIAPVVGAMAADRLRSRGQWSGPRRRYNLAGLIAWVLGAAVGLAPSLARMASRSGLDAMQPAAVMAFAMAFVTSLIVAATGFEAPRDPRPEVMATPGPS
jgi:cytosine permease